MNLTTVFRVFRAFTIEKQTIKCKIYEKNKIKINHIQKQKMPRNNLHKIPYYAYEKEEFIGKQISKSNRSCSPLLIAFELMAIRAACEGQSTVFCKLITMFYLLPSGWILMKRVRFVLSCFSVFITNSYLFI